ncbi:MAG: hypothetical protein MZV70_39715 [Desulfobacterales bacterium]|nr:hypothetical protein [Desulfobacterales bacterium]
MRGFGVNPKIPVTLAEITDLGLSSEHHALRSPGERLLVAGQPVPRTSPRPGGTSTRSVPAGAWCSPICARLGAFPRLRADAAARAGRVFPLCDRRRRAHLGDGRGRTECQLPAGVFQRPGRRVVGSGRRYWTALLGYRRWRGRQSRHHLAVVCRGQHARCL